MARYRAVWLELARVTRESLPAPERAALDARVEQLLENPHAADRGGYDPTSDSFATTYGEGFGLLTYALVADRETLIVLRVM